AIDLDVLVSASTEGGKGSDEPGSSEGLRKERPKNQRIHDILSNNKREKAQAAIHLLQCAGQELQRVYQQIAGSGSGCGSCAKSALRCRVMVRIARRLSR